MITISVCMIVKDEEHCLDRCLKSLVSIADEFIIVDTGSSDHTKDIAKKYTDKVYDFKWTGSFSDARNYSFSLATKDYIYCADADFRKKRRCPGRPAAAVGTRPRCLQSRSSRCRAAASFRRR